MALPVACNNQQGHLKIKRDCSRVTSIKFIVSHCLTKRQGNTMATSDRQITEREIKALQIAATSKLTRKGNVWIVPSQVGHGEYKVNPDPQAPRCTCPDFEFRQAPCKHVI